MNRRERSTLDLWARYSRAMQGVDALSQSRFPFMRQRRRARRIVQASDLEGHLARRYSGLANAVLRAGHPAGLPTHVAVSYLELALGELRNEARVEQDARRLPGVFWHALTESIPPPVDVVEFLRPRFLLEPFVDAMPSGEAKRLVDGSSIGRGQVRFDATTLARAAELLALELRHRSADVEAWTAGFLSGARVARMITPYVELQVWLTGL